MALTKVTYTDNVTVISADNLNDIQDEIIAYEPKTLNYFSQISANTSRTFTVPNTTRGLILLQRGSDTASATGLYSLVSTSQGAIYIAALSSASDVTFSKSTNSLTITNSGANIYISYIGNKMIGA